MESHDSNVKGEQHKCEHSECHHVCSYKPYY